MQHESLLGWHFVGETLRDGRPIPQDGEWIMHDGPIVPCKSGLHMSVDPFDALCFATGATLCRVELAGEIVGHGDPVGKYVGRRRMVLSRIDATQLLRRFAADQALSAAHLWDMPDVVRQYLETLDESIRDAARDASPKGPEWCVTAGDLALSAFHAAAHSDAWAAAHSAAYYVAPEPLHSQVRADFSRRVYSAFSLSD